MIKLVHWNRNKSNLKDAQNPLSKYTDESQHANKRDFHM